MHMRDARLVELVRFHVNMTNAQHGFSLFLVVMAGDGI